MNLKRGLFLLLLLFRPVFAVDPELVDFDDDAFLSSKIEPSQSGELVGWSLFRSKDEEDRYIINFKGVSVLEYINFISRISDLNFQYEAKDLDFTVTVVSEEPLTVQNIVSVLIQSLRARGLTLLEQEGTLLITTSKTINQIPTIVPYGKAGDAATTAPIVTRVFRIQNANLASVISILKPMMSQGSMIEASIETRQLIVTDITTNVDKIATLLQSLDIPHSPLEVDLYKAKHLSAETLVPMTKKIVEPFSEGNPIIFVPQTETNSIFIVSTPYLIERAMEVMEDLDSKPRGLKGPIGDQVFLYKVQNKSADVVLSAIENIAEELQKSGAPNTKLIASLKGARWIKGSNSLLFVSDIETEAKIAFILKTLDSPENSRIAGASKFWLYTPQHLSGKELEEAINDLEDGLSATNLDDEGLEAIIDSMRWIPATNTMLFAGDAASIEKIQAMIKLIDVASSTSSNIFIYSPKFLLAEQIEEALDELADKLDHKSLVDKNLAKAIDDMSWITETKVFLFKADPTSIEKIEQFLADIDTSRESEIISSGYFLYNLKYASGDTVIDQLEKVAKNLSPKDSAQKTIIDVIDNASFLKDTNSILLTGSQKGVEEVKALIAQFDEPNATPTSSAKTSFFIYKPEYLTLDELKDSLQEMASDLKASGLVDPSLLQSISTMRLVEMTGSAIFTGTKDSLAKTKEIIDMIDIKGAQFEGGDNGKKQERNFIIYIAKHKSPEELLKTLDEVAVSLEKQNRNDNKAVIKAIKSARVIKESGSLLFTGSPDTLAKIETILKEYDEVGGTEDSTSGAGDYVIYKPMNVSGPELIDMMQDFETNLKKSGVREPFLYRTINNLKYIERTNHILISGDPKSVEKVRELLGKFDIPGQKSTVTSLHQLERSFLVYKLQYHPGSDIQETLKKVAVELNDEGEQKSELLKAINSLQWIKITNSLLATGTPNVLTQLKELIQNVDVPLRQVFIEVLIIQTTLNNNQQFGLQWGGKVQYLNRFAGGTSNFPSTNPSAPNIPANAALRQPLIDVNATRSPLATDIPNPSSNGGFDLGVIGDIILHRGKSFLSLASLVNAIQQDADSVVVMNPKIIAQDNQQSTIFVGENIPFTGSNVTTNGAAQQISTNIEYRDVGVNLAITPILGSNEIVTLDISNEITAQVSNTTSGTNIQGLQTSRTSLNARVHVPNKHFVALSGMIQDTKSRFRSGIPCLGGLPVIGAIFSENDRLASRNNVIFFIRPVIIDSIEEYKQITENQEAVFKSRVPKQVAKEDIDDAINWVQDPDCY